MMKYSKVVAVTGASGFIGSHLCKNLVEHGYTVRACVRDIKPEKTDHLLALNQQNDEGGRLQLVEADMMVEGAYDTIFEGCSTVFHVAGNFGTDSRWRQATQGLGRPPPIDQALGSQQERVKSYDQGVYDSYVLPMKYILNSIKHSKTVKRLVYTSSACAGPTISETNDVYESVQDNAYGKGKVDCERLLYKFGKENPGIICVSCCPDVVLGPLLASPVHDNVYQHRLGDMLAGKYLLDHEWWITDVRDVAETQRCMAESSIIRNGSRFWNGSEEAWSTGDLLELAKEAFPQFAANSKLQPKQEEADGDDDEDSGSVDESMSDGEESTNEDGSGSDDDCSLDDDDSYGISEWEEHGTTTWSDPVQELGLVRRHVKETIQDTVQSLIELGALNRPLSTQELRDYYNVAEMDGCDEECQYILSKLKKREGR